MRLERQGLPVFLVTILLSLLSAQASGSTHFTEHCLLACLFGGLLALLEVWSP